MKLRRRLRASLEVLATWLVVAALRVGKGGKKLGCGRDAAGGDEDTETLLVVTVVLPDPETFE